MTRSFRPAATRGQALVEFALIAPLLFLLIGGVITTGIGVFYQQQLTNAAREAARYAAIHSETSQCPTISNREPYASMLPPEVVDYDCDPPWLRWPEMSAHARSMVWGIDSAQIRLVACWSGFWDNETNGYDAAPAKSDGAPNEFQSCTVRSNDPAYGLIHIDPRTGHEIDLASGLPLDRDGDGEPDDRPITCSSPLPTTTEGDDQASSLAHSGIGTANQVTVFACYVWAPPFIGELLGGPVTLRAVITEAMQHQQ